MKPTRTSLDDPYDASLPFHRPSSGQDEYSYFDTVQDGFELVWNTRLNDAEKFFSDLEHDDPRRNLWKLAALAEVSFWKAVYNGDEVNFATALSLLDDCQKFTAPYCVGYKRGLVARKAMDFMGMSSALSAADIQEKRLYLEYFVAEAQICLAKALLYTFHINYIKSPYYWRKAWVWFSRSRDFRDQLLSSGASLPDELNGDVQFGMGLFHFMMGMVPPNFQWFVTMLGFESNKEGSYKELEESWGSGCMRNVNAALLLMWLRYLLQEDTASSKQILDVLTTRYPTSALIQITAAYFHFLEGDIDDATHWYLECAKSAPEAPMVDYVCTYLLGTVYWGLCEWDKCAEATEYYLKNSISPHFRCYGNYRLAFCYWMAGKFDQVEETLKLVPEYRKENLEHDVYACQMAKKFFDNDKKFTKFDVLFTSTYCLLEVKQYDKATYALDALSAFIKDEFDGPEPLETVETVYNYCRAWRLYGLKRHSEASDIFISLVLPKCYSISDTPESYITAYSLTMLGEMMYASGDYETADSFFSEASKLREYNFQKYVHYRITRGLENIKKKKAGKEVKDSAKGIVADAQKAVHIHQMEAVRFGKPTWCDFCKAFVSSPFGKQGYQCKTCAYKIHKECLSACPNCKVVG